MRSLTRKAQITRDEFMRQLPSAIEGATWQQQGNAIVVTPEHGKQVTLMLTELGIEEKGALDLPMLRIDFTFEGMTDVDVDEFMDAWDENKLRVGG